MKIGNYDGVERVPNKRNTYKFDIAKIKQYDGEPSSRKELTLDKLDIPDGSTLIIDNAFVSGVYLRTPKRKYTKLTIIYTGTIYIKEKFKCDKLVVKDNDECEHQPGCIGSLMVWGQVPNIIAKGYKVALESNEVKNINIDVLGVASRTSCWFTGKCYIKCGSLDVPNSIASGWYCDTDCELTISTQYECSFKLNRYSSKCKSITLHSEGGSVDARDIRTELLKIHTNHVTLRCGDRFNVDVCDIKAVWFNLETISGTKHDDAVFNINEGIIKCKFFNEYLTRHAKIEGKFVIDYLHVITIGDKLSIGDGVSILWKDNTEVNIASSTNAYQMFLDSGIKVRGGEFNDSDALKYLDKFNDTSQLRFTNVGYIPPHIKSLKCHSIEFNSKCAKLHDIEIEAHCVKFKCNIGNNVSITCDEFILVPPKLRDVYPKNWFTIGNNVTINARSLETYNIVISKVGNNVTFGCTQSNKFIGFNNNSLIRVRGNVGDNFKVLPSPDGHRFDNVRISRTSSLKWASIATSYFTFRGSHELMTYGIGGSRFLTGVSNVDITDITDIAQYDVAKRLIESKSTIEAGSTFTMTYKPIEEMGVVKVGELCSIDGLNCVIKATKPKYNAYMVDIVGSNFKPNIWVVYGSPGVPGNDNMLYSHSTTYKGAMESLQHKVDIIRREAEIKDKIEVYKKRGLDIKYSLEEMLSLFRMVTGACEFGCRHFIEQHNITGKFTIREVCNMESITFARDKFINMFM